MSGNVIGTILHPDVNDIGLLKEGFNYVYTRQFAFAGTGGHLVVYFFELYISDDRYVLYC